MMRRRRLGMTQQSEMTADVDVREALSFDVSQPHDDSDEAIAEQRQRQLHHVPILIGIAHLVAMAACLLLGLGADTFGFRVLGGLLALDVLTIAGIRIAGNLDIRPHLVTRALTLYVALCAVAWTYFSVSLLDVSGSSLAIPAALIGGGIIAMAVAATTAPAIAIVLGLSGAFATFAFTGHSVVTVGIAIMALIISAYATAYTRTNLATARRRLMLDAHAHQALRFVTEFEGSGRGWFWETDSTGVLSYVSRQLAEDFDCDPADLLGRKFTDLLSVDDQGTGDALREERTLGFHLSARFPFSDVVVRAARDEDVLWTLSGNTIFSENNGKFLGFRGIGTDLTEQRRNEQEISRLARFDSLTGLPNRAMMRQTLDEALRNAARRQKGCALFLIDLDRFKNVNDTLGHPVGDQLLRQESTRLTNVMGNHGQVGRLGGDEFKAVLPGAVEAGLLENLARLMIEQVSQPYQIEGHRVTIGASIGIAIADPGRACADSLTRNADLALYAAKAAGRGTFSFFKPEMHSEATDRQVLENDLRGALDRDELEVRYQPIVRASNEEICGFEALVRWDHPSRGPISPEVFISIAEECGLINSLGEFVLRESIATAAKWPETVRMAVNLSPIQFNNPKLSETIAALLSAHEMRAERLELELTEGIFLSEGEATDEIFSRLKNIGVRLALDDFGTGYSSLGYLKTAPFDKIKIDQSFVRGASNVKSRNSAIIRAIVALAESLGMDTTAEGVETHDDLHLIRELGCSQIQGYIFGRPGTAEEATELVKNAALSPDGHQNSREPRHRLMRRGLVGLRGERVEVRLRNISAMGALIECPVAVTPGAQLTIDIVGTGPVKGSVRWAQSGRFGIQFDEGFDLTRLAPIRKNNGGATHSFSAPIYGVDRQAG